MVRPRSNNSFSRSELRCLCTNNINVIPFVLVEGEMMEDILPCGESWSDAENILEWHQIRHVGLNARTVQSTAF